MHHRHNIPRQIGSIRPRRQIPLRLSPRKSLPQRRLSVARRAISSFRIGSASSPQASAPCTIKHPFGFPGHESKSAVPTINLSATARAVGNFSASAVKPVIFALYRSSAFRNNASLFPNVA